MKKLLPMLLAVLILAGCAAAPEEDTTASIPETTLATEPAETEPTETEPPVPETVSGTVLADQTPILLTTRNRGDSLQIVDDYDDTHYVVKLETGYGLVEKRLLRPEGELYESWEGYAQYNAVLYADYMLTTPIGETLGLNTKLLVLDDLEGVLVVQLEETVGYMATEQVSTFFIQPYSGGGSGGGADGGDISLGYSGGIALLATLVPQEGDSTGPAAVLADGTEILLGWFQRNEEVRIVTEAGFVQEMEGFHAVYLDGLYGYVRQELLLREGDTPYEAWTGYAQYNGVLYSGYGMTGEATTLGSNAQLTILAELDSCYLAEYEGATGYIAKESVSTYPIVYSGGSGGGGGEWTPPAL